MVGGSSGIGLALVKSLYNQGATVIVASRTPEKVSHEFSDKVSFYALDASCEQSVKTMFSELGELDGIVSTIKPSHLVGDFLETPVDDSKQAFNAKFWGQLHLARHGSPTLVKGGAIVLTSGIAASKAFRGYASTAAINGAIESLVRSLSIELSPIRINAVSPGFVERFPDDHERLNKVNALRGQNIPLARLATQQEVVEAYLYLLNSTYSTGSIVTVDGGVLAV